ncbi:cysteine dioxygenase family protein [filamentous cyanobacterium LEGE 11480]|uniref:Cysteine dioxygenase family protein n=1 Tax=Romeriopsis navalis LEGE 11480 TaxID=2777977 RepID=A0A928Z2K3_9CYAN|nr:cysteine dioxygenase family protein [Romeriopsis navalis]MBE9028218.1 cysteine dioxygenase family protein [Romeriopsis navalis LEGE 11480]
MVNSVALPRTILPATIPSNSTPTIASLPTRLQQLIINLRATSQMTPELAQAYVKSAHIQVADLLPWAEFNHPVSHSYGRQLVYAEPNFEIMVMSWLPGDFSAIHDHGSAQWGAVQSFGAAEHGVYRFTQGQLQTSAIHPFKAGTVLAVNHDLIHQMGNPSDTPMLSLHIYGAYEYQGEITGDARIFDLFEQTIQYTDGGVFFGLPEEDIMRRTTGLTGDRPTTLRHHQQMLDRADKILSQTPTPIWAARADALKQTIATIH